MVIHLNVFYSHLITWEHWWELFISSVLLVLECQRILEVKCDVKRYRKVPEKNISDNSYFLIIEANSQEILFEKINKNW